MYMDTSAAAKLYFREEASDAVQRLASECGPLTSTELLVTEMTSVASRKYAKQLISRREQKRFKQLFVEHIDTGYWNLLPFSLNDFQIAGDLILKCQDKVQLRTLDALHLAICTTYRVYPLCTFDHVMLCAAEILDIPVQQIEGQNKRVR